MPAVRRRTAAEVALALLWSMFGGALIGGAGVTAWSVIADGERMLASDLLSVLAAPFGIAAFSLIVVIPCTMAFGVPSVALIHHFALGRRAALAVCVALAIATQIATVLLFWRSASIADACLFATPFALGAAVVLWWQMTRA